MSASRDDSFDVETNSPFYFNTSHWNAVDGILEGVRERSGLMLLTGPTGSGKTMIMRAVSEGLEENTPGLFLQYASLNFREFVSFLHSSLNVEDEIMDAANKAVALREFLYVQAKRDETGVVFIDEAHNLEPDVLKMLPKLARFDTLEDGRIVGLQFVMVASEDLREILEDEEFDEVREKIAVDHTLRFFTRAELKQFLAKRLAPIARVTDEPITEDGVTEMERFTGGSPRLVGMICSHAMLFAAENPGKSIDAAMVKEAAEALMLSPVEDAFAGDGAETSADAPFSEAEISGGARTVSSPPAPRTETIYSPKEDEDTPMDPSLRSGEDDATHADPKLDTETSFQDMLDDTADQDRSEDTTSRSDKQPAFDPAAFDRTLDDDDDDDLDDLDEFDDDDDLDETPKGKASILAGGTAFLKRLGLGSRGTSARPPKIVGAGRKKEKTDAPVVSKPARRGPKPRVKGEREAKLKKAGIGVAAVAVLGVGYVASKPVISAVSGLFAGSPQLADVPSFYPSDDSGPSGMQAALSDIPAFQPSGGQAGAVGRPAGDTVSVDIDNNSSASNGGWGSRVVVQIENAPPLRDAEMAPVLPAGMAGVAKGALDMVDRALNAGETGAKSEKIGGLLAAASDTVSQMRSNVAKSGMTPDQLAAEAGALVVQGDEHFAAKRFIAPSGGNAYDAYREALTLQPENQRAQAGITNLREHFATKAEGARDAKQWENANNFFEIAIAISNLRAVN